MPGLVAGGSELDLLPTEDEEDADERRAPADVHDDAARARGLAVAEAWRSDLAIAEAER